MPITLNISKIRARFRKENSATLSGRQAGIEVIAEVMTRTLAAEAPTDTNRYVRGWIEAGQGAGVKDVPLPMLKKSRYRDKIIANLTVQVSVMQRRLDELKADAARRKKGMSPRLASSIATAQGRLEKAQDALRRFAGDETALAIMRKYSYVLVGNEKRIRASAVNIEVRDQVYGGTGSVVHGPDRSVLQLHDLEPHSTAVERRSHTLAKAKDAVTGLGLRNLRKKYIEQIRGSWKLGPKRKSA